MFIKQFRKRYKMCWYAKLLEQARETERDREREGGRGGTNQSDTYTVRTISQSQFQSLGRPAYLILSSIYSYSDPGFEKNTPKNIENLWVKSFTWIHIKFMHD